MRTHSQKKKKNPPLIHWHAKVTFSIPDHSECGRGDNHVMKLLPVSPCLNQADQHGQGGDEEHHSCMNMCIECINTQEHVYTTYTLVHVEYTPAV